MNYLEVSIILFPALVALQYLANRYSLYGRVYGRNQYDRRVDYAGWGYKETIALVVIVYSLGWFVIGLFCFGIQ